MEENVKLVEAGLEAYNAQDWDAFFAGGDESIVVYAPDLMEPAKGLAAYRERFETNAAAFPDRQIEKTRIFGQGDWVCVEGIFTGTHTGAFTTPAGDEIPPTNKKVEVWLALVFKLANGKVIEEHDYYDQMSFFSQLGLAP